jgi:hypothetical protein
MVTLTKDGNTVRITTKEGKIFWQSIDIFMNGFTLDKATMKVSFSTPKISKTAIPIAEIDINGVSGITTEEDLGLAIKDLVKMSTNGAGGGGISDDNEGYLIEIIGDETINVAEGEELDVVDFGDWTLGDGWTNNAGASASYNGNGVINGLKDTNIALNVLSGGSGYVVNDIVDVPGGDNTGQLRITAVDGGGNVQTAIVETKGSNYQPDIDTIFIPTGGSGTGLRVSFNQFTINEARINFNLIQGAKYHVKFTAVVTAGTLNVQTGDQGQANAVTSSGNKSFYMTHQLSKYQESIGGYSIKFSDGDGNFVGTVSNVSIKRVIDIDAPAYQGLQQVVGIDNDADGFEILDITPAQSATSVARFDQVAKDISGGFKDFSSGWTMGEGWSLNEMFQAEYDGTGIAGKVLTVSVVPTFGGANYAVNDTVKLDGDGDGNAVLNVDSVDGGGAILTASVVTPGVGYHAEGNSLSTTTLTGVGSGANFFVETVSHNYCFRNDQIADFTKTRIHFRTTGLGSFQTFIGGTSGGTTGGVGEITFEAIEEFEYYQNGSDTNIARNLLYRSLIRIVPFNNQPFVVKQWKFFLIPQTDRILNARNVLDTFTWLRWAVLTQTGINNPGSGGLGRSGMENVIWERQDVGVYTGTKKLQFTGNNVIMPMLSFADAGAGDTNMIKVTYIDQNQIKIETFGTDHVTPADDVLNQFALMILNFSD